MFASAAFLCVLPFHRLLFYSSSYNSGGIFSRLGRSTSEKRSYDLQYAAIMPATMLHNAAAAILMKQCLYLSALSLISRR